MEEKKIYVVGVINHYDRHFEYHGRKEIEVKTETHFAYIREIPCGVSLSQYGCEYPNKPFEAQQFIYIDRESAEKKCNDINNDFKKQGIYNTEY